MIAAVAIGPDREEVAISEASLTRSLENAVSGLRFGTFEDRGTQLGAEIRAELYDLPAFVGTVETWLGSPEAGFTPTARSNTVSLQLVDALANERMREASVFRITEELCARVDVLFDAGAAEDYGVKRFRIRRGTSYQRAIQTLCESRGYVLTDDADGRAVLYRAPRDRTPLEVWEEGHEPVRSIKVLRSIRDWRDEIVCRGQRAPEPGDVDDPTLSAVAASIIASNTRTSRRVIENRAARSKATAAVLVADEARKALARAVQADVVLSDTARQPGEIVLVRKPSSNFAEPMVISSMTWSVSAQEARINATCVLVAAYDATGVIAADIARGRAA